MVRLVYFGAGDDLLPVILCYKGEHIEYFKPAYKKTVGNVISKQIIDMLKDVDEIIYIDNDAGIIIDDDEKENATVWKSKMLYDMVDLARFSDRETDEFSDTTDDDGAKYIEFYVSYIIFRYYYRSDFNNLTPTLKKFVSDADILYIKGTNPDYIEDVSYFNMLKYVVGNTDWNDPDNRKEINKLLTRFPDRLKNLQYKCDSFSLTYFNTIVELSGTL